MATSRASQDGSGCCCQHLSLNNLLLSPSVTLFIDKVETEPQTLWALMRLSGKMHTELHTWLLFHLSDPLPQPHFPGGQSEESSGVLKSEDKGELVKVMGKGLGHATALRV